MPADPFLARRERFERVGSTNDVVRDWLESGTPEVCLAVAGEQTAGRGRDGRTWAAPPDAGLLLSIGFRPVWLAAERVWRLAAIVALAMAEAGESVAGLEPGSIRLKWPNDLVIETRDGTARKVAGVLGETVGLGGADPRAIVGIGINTDWPAQTFPAELAGAMTSLHEAARGRPIDNSRLLEGFVGRLEAGTRSLREERFDTAGWVARQMTNGRPVRLDAADGSSTVVHAIGVDPASGGLVVEDRDGPAGRRTVLSGEIVHLRLADGRRADRTALGV